MIKKILITTVIILFLIIGWVILNSISSQKTNKYDKSKFPTSLNINYDASFAIEGWLYFFDPMGQTNIDLVVWVDRPEISERQEYTYWFIFNKYGLQIYNQQKVEYETKYSFNIILPPNPPYIIYARNTWPGYITMNGDKKIAWAEIVSYEEEYDIDYIINVEDSMKEGETTFQSNETVFYIYDHYRDKIEKGNRYGDLYILDPQGRVVALSGYHNTGNKVRYYGYTGMPGMWKLYLILDTYSAGTTTWNKTMSFKRISPAIKELGFDFPYPGY